MRLRLVSLGLLITLTALAADADRLEPKWKKIHAAVIAEAADLKWRDIPWLLDLDEGVKQAKEEKRPLMLWVAGDDPLDRC